MKTTRRGIRWMIGFVALWALAGWLSRPYSAYQVVRARYGSHSAIMVAICGWRDPLVLVRTRRPVLQIARSSLMLVMPAAWILGLQRGLTPDTVLAIFGVAPLMSCALATVLLKERPTRGVWVSAAIVSAGAMFCLSLHALPSLTAATAALTSAGSFSLCVVVTRMLRGESLRANLFYTALGVFAGLSLFVPNVWVTPAPHDTLVMVLIGALGLLALLVLDRTAQTAPVSSGGAMVDARQLVPIGGVVVGRHPDLHTSTQ